MQISSKGKRVLVFSDPHQQIDLAKKIIAHEKADYNVCAGDWIDSHVADSRQDAEKTAKYLRLWVFDPKNITCIGNHDLPHFYFGLNKHTYCSGYSEGKNTLINDIWESKKWDIWDKFQWYLWVDDYLISHAGLNIFHVMHPVLGVPSFSKESFSKWLNIQLEDAKRCLSTGQQHWIYGAGRIRGGDQAKGGITWQDYREFEPITGLDQIFGHTVGDNVRKDENNYCIDTHLSEYLIIENGNLSIKKVKDL